MADLKPCPFCGQKPIVYAIGPHEQLEADKQQLEGMLTHMNQLRDAAAGRALKMEERVRQLETDNSQLRNYIRLLQTERDAAIHDMNEAQSIVCLICKNYYQPDPAVKKYGCKVLGEHFGEGSIFCGMFEWRGVQKEGWAEDGT